MANQIRDLPDTKKEIEGIFQKGRTLYYSDISQELGLSLRTVVKICGELQSEGKIEAANAN